MTEKAIGAGIATILLSLIALFVWKVVDDNHHEERFMTECQQDHKRYECEAMWRAGESHTQTVAVPIYVHH